MTNRVSIEDFYVVAGSSEWALYYKAKPIPIIIKVYDEVWLTSRPSANYSFWIEMDVREFCKQEGLELV